MPTVPRPWTPHILIVDDNRHFADALSRLLEAWSFQPRVAYDGPSAVEAALTHTPDVILLDIGLPGLDGYALARRLRCQPGLERTLLVAVTGFAWEADLQRAVEAGFDHFLVKPVNLEELRRLLEALTCSSAGLDQVPPQTGHANEDLLSRSIPNFLGRKSLRSHLRGLETTIGVVTQAQDRAIWERSDCAAAERDEGFQGSTPSLGSGTNVRPADTVASAQPQL